LSAPRVTRLAGLALLAGLAAAPLAAGVLAPDAARRLTEWIAELGPAGPAILLVVQALVAASGIVPASGVGIAAGALLGPVAGFCVAAAGTMVGALATFAFARTVFGARALARLGGRRLAALDGALAQEGWRLVCLIRLSPIMPFAPTSLALGASTVRLRDYAIGTLAALPALFAYVALGALGQGGGHLLSGAGAGDWLRLGMLAAGAVATVVLMLRLRRILGRAMPAAADASESLAGKPIIPTRPPHPEVPRSGLEGGLQGSQGFLESSFEARQAGHLRMRSRVGRELISRPGSESDAHLHRGDLPA
jgi:uncharacterized membrane protein YdjX (TVP38/TMEM64 family)